MSNDITKNNTLLNKYIGKDNERLISKDDNKEVIEGLPTNYLFEKTDSADFNKLSDIEVTPSGIKSNTKILLNEFSSRIIEINSIEVIVECIVDTENITIETRRFNKLLFEGLKNLVQGRLIIIQFLQGRLEQTIKIIGDVDGRVNENDFNLNTPEKILREIDFSKFNKY